MTDTNTITEWLLGMFSSTGEGNEIRVGRGARVFPNHIFVAQRKAFRKKVEVEIRFFSVQKGNSHNLDDSKIEFRSRFFGPYEPGQQVFFEIIVPGRFTRTGLIAHVAGALRR